MQQNQKSNNFNDMSSVWEMWGPQGFMFNPSTLERVDNGLKAAAKVAVSIKSKCFILNAEIKALNKIIDSLKDPNSKNVYSPVANSKWMEWFNNTLNKTYKYIQTNKGVPYNLITVSPDDKNKYVKDSVILSLADRIANFPYLFQMDNQNKEFYYEDWKMNVYNNIGNLVNKINGKNFDQEVWHCFSYQPTPNHLLPELPHWNNPSGLGFKTEGKKEFLEQKIFEFSNSLKK